MIYTKTGPVEPSGKNIYEESNSDVADATNQGTTI
jgi:hypothetical protein